MFSRPTLQFHLHFEKKSAVFPEKINLLAFHGLLGQKSNMRFLYSNPKIFNYTKHVYLLDLRNHGDSPHYNGNSLDHLAQDINNFIQKHELDNVCLLGHSFGARGIMEFLRLFKPTQDKVRGAVILDMLPGKLDHLDVVLKTYQMINSLSKINLEFIDVCGDAAAAGFLIQNIVLVDDEDYKYKYTTKPLTYKWKCNIQSILESYTHNASQDIQVDWKGQTLFLCGDKSNYVNQENQKEFKRFSNSKTIFIQGAGHMLHVEQPKKVVEEIVHFLQTI